MHFIFKNLKVLQRKKTIKRGNLKESLAKCSFKEMGFEVPFKKSCSLKRPDHPWCTASYVGFGGCEWILNGVYVSLSGG